MKILIIESVGLIQKLPLELGRNIRFQMDGCPAHCSRDVGNWMDQNFPGWGVGRGGPVTWLAQDQDLIPGDFNLKIVRSQVYDTTVDIQKNWWSKPLPYTTTSRDDKLRRITNVPSVQNRFRITALKYWMPFRTMI